MQPPRPEAPYLGYRLIHRLRLPMGWTISSRQAVASRTVFPGIPNVAPKGFLGKLDPEGTATWALRQPCTSSPLARLRVWLMVLPLPRPCCPPAAQGSHVSVQPLLLVPSTGLGVPSEHGVPSASRRNLPTLLSRLALCRDREL